MSTSVQETQRQTLLQLWSNGERDIHELERITKLNIRTIYRYIKKIQETGTIEHAGNNGRQKKITAGISRALGQFIRRDSAISLRTMATKLIKTGINISYRTIARHLHETGYKKSLPLKVPMLTDAHKQKRILWAQEHLNDNWNRTFFRTKRHLCSLGIL
jgi:transposase